MTYVTAELCRQLLRYEPDTGKLFWLPRSVDGFSSKRAAAVWNGRYANREAFTNIIPGGYRTGTIMNQSRRAHRVIWAIVNGEWPSLEIDHVNGDPLDNRLVNLRTVDSAANKRNCRLRSDNTSGCVGVTWNRRRRKWMAKVPTTGGRQREVGHFDTLDAAVAARLAAASDLGFTSRHGEAL